MILEGPLGKVEFVAVLFVIGCMIWSLQLLARLHNRTLLGYTRSVWKSDGTASRSWYILAIRVYTQRWFHSTYLQE